MVSRVSGLVCASAVGLAGAFAVDARAVETVISDAFLDNSAAAAVSSFEADWTLSSNLGVPPVVANNRLEITLPFNSTAVGTASEDRSATLTDIGDIITLTATIDATAFASPGDQGNNAFRIALYSSMGTASLSDDQGYEAILGIGPGRSGLVQARVGSQNTTGSFGGPIGDSDLTLGVTSVLDISFSLELLSSTEIGVTFMVGTSTLFSDVFDHSALSAPFTTPFVTFDQIVLGAAGNTVGNGETLIVDNLELTYVPEPAALTLLGMGVLAMTAQRRRQ